MLENIRRHGTIRRHNFGLARRAAAGLACITASAAMVVGGAVPAGVAADEPPAATARELGAINCYPNGAPRRMTAITKAHGAAPTAFIILPLVSAFFIDLANAVAIGWLVR